MDSQRLVKLCEASVAKSFVPEKDVGWGAPLSESRSVLPESLLSLADTAEFRALNPDERANLARHELASMFSAFIRFEDNAMRKGHPPHSDTSGMS